jgi:hypothetical protein
METGQEVHYEEEKYLAFRTIPAFAIELKRARRAILMTSFQNLPDQMKQIFAVVSDAYGLDSAESHSVTASRLFCGNCGAAFISAMLMTIIVPYRNTSTPAECPKCKAESLTLLTRL